MADADDKNKPNLPPPSEPFPGSKTPGWNDPPALPYNSGNVGRTRLNLNKRVAFPLQGTVGADTNTAKPTAIVPPNQASMGLPPPMSLPTTTQPIAVVHPMPPASTVTTNVSQPDANVVGAPTITTLPADAIAYCMRILREQIALVTESSPNVRRDEIERRVGIIEQLWQSNNLTVPLQEKLYRLANAISERSYTDAMDIYTSLVTNHANECSTWAVALRHVVLTLQQPSDEELTTGIAVSSDNSSNIPAMYVPAMPRQVLSSESATATATTTATTGIARSAVQHI